MGLGAPPGSVRYSGGGPAGLPLGGDEAGEAEDVAADAGAMDGGVVGAAKVVACNDAGDSTTLATAGSLIAPELRMARNACGVAILTVVYPCVATRGCAMLPPADDDDDADGAGVVSGRCQ